MVFETGPYQYSKDTLVIMRLTFFNLVPKAVSVSKQIMMIFISCPLQPKIFLHIRDSKMQDR